MPADFEWRTDEDDSHWEEQLPPSRVKTDSGLPGGRSLSRIRPVLIIIILLTIAVAGAFYGLANRKVEEATTTAETELLQSYLLIQQAAAVDDLDVFMALVDDDSRNWYDLQYDLFRHHLYLDRPTLGLEARPLLSATTILSNVQVALSPDLVTATLTISQPYVVRHPDGVTETIDLIRTEIYRRQEAAWRLAELPEEEGFWGNWVTNRGRNLTLIYPRRDEEIGQRLAVVLDELVGQMCDEVGEWISCSSDEVQVRLARDPDSLMRLNNDYESRFYGNTHITLPAPSLVGRPQDEAGYQALYRGYASWVVTMLGGNAPPGYLSPFLAQHDLQPPPAPFVPLPAVVAFIEEPSEPWPDEDLVLICSNGLSMDLLRYDPRANQWHREMIARDAPILSQILVFDQSILAQGAPYNDGLLVTVNVPDPDQAETSWQTYLWRHGREQYLFAQPQPYFILPNSLQRIFDPTEDRIILVMFSMSSDEVSFGYVDYGDCLAGDCEVHLLPAYPNWSTDGRHVLMSNIADQDALEVVLSDESGRTLGTIDHAIWPFWLDNESFILLRTQWLEQAARPSDYITEVMRGRLAPETEAGYILESVLDEQDLRQALPEEMRPAELDINFALVHRDHPERWFISAIGNGAQNQSTEYSFLYLSANDDVFAVPQMNGALTVFQPFLSPDGRYLATYDYDNSRVMILDMTSDPTDPVIATYRGEFSYIDWSADGRWVVLIGRDEMLLADLESGFDRRIPHELNLCQGAAWVMPEQAQTAGSRP